MPDAPVGETFEQRRARIAGLRRLNSVLPKEQRRTIPPLHEPAAPGPDTGPDEPPGPTVEALLAMPRNAYAQLVCDSLSADKDNLWALYLDPRLVQFTYSVLIRKHTAVTRLTDHTRESAESKVGRSRWKFIDLLESRIQQAEAALPDTVLASDRGTAHRLFAAIQAHRRAMTLNGAQPEPWDLRLWQTLDSLTPADQGPAEPGEPDAPTPVP